MVHQNLTIRQIYFLALENGSQTHSSVEREIFLSIDSGREPQRSPIPPPPLRGRLNPHLSRQTDVFSLKSFPGRQTPAVPLVPTLGTFLPPVSEAEDQLPGEGQTGPQGPGRKQGS